MDEYDNSEARTFWDEEDEYIAEGEVIEEQSEKMEGLCPKCLNTGYVMENRNGSLGILYTENGQDSAGKPIRKLMVCGHGTVTNY